MHNFRYNNCDDCLCCFNVVFIVGMIFGHAMIYGFIRFLV